MNEWHIFDKVYRRWVVFFIGPTDDFVAELKRCKYTDDTDWFKGAKGACILLDSSNHDGGQDATVVWLRDFETSTLVHEVTHLAMLLFNQVGVPISLDNTEAFAFYTEYWFTQFLKVRRKYPNGNQPKDARK